MANLRIQRPYRKPLHPGDVFSLQYGDSRFLFGRIVAVDVAFGGFESGCIGVHIYRAESRSANLPEGLIESDLLIAPHYVNRLGFSRGYMPVIGSIPLCAADKRMDVCYRDAVRNRLVDDSGSPVDQPRRFIGFFGMGNFETLDEEISRALGIPPESEASS